jgi:hypothetical protein
MGRPGLPKRSELRFSIVADRIDYPAPSGRHARQPTCRRWRQLLGGDRPKSALWAVRPPLIRVAKPALPMCGNGRNVRRQEGAVKGLQEGAHDLRRRQGLPQFAHIPSGYALRQLAGGWQNAFFHHAPDRSTGTAH